MHLKFDCHEILGHAEALEHAKVRLVSLRNDLAGATSELRSMTGFSEILREIDRSQIALQGSSVQLERAVDAIDQIVDLYYRSHWRTLDISRGLPTGNTQETPTAAAFGLGDPGDFWQSSGFLFSDRLVYDAWLAEEASRLLENPTGHKSGSAQDRQW